MWLVGDNTNKGVVAFGRDVWAFFYIYDVKDNFSSNSQNYAKFRPRYPNEFFDYLNSIISNKGKAWDCGTGNGQVAHELARTFDRVYATDISHAQLNNAIKADNIYYSAQPAEHTNFEPQTFDLIVVAQAIHWFDFDKFYREVRRTAKMDARICVLGYGRIEVSPEIDTLVNEFYTKEIGTYWDAERKYIDKHYATIPFPFTENKTPRFVNEQRWGLGHLIGYLNTWSAVKHYIRKNGVNPVKTLEPQLMKHWKSGEEKKVKFPILLRLGTV